MHNCEACNSFSSGFENVDIILLFVPSSIHASLKGKTNAQDFPHALGARSMKERAYTGVVVFAVLRNIWHYLV